MSDLMIGNDQLLLIGKNTVLFLITGNYNFNALFKICLSRKFTSITNRSQCRLIDNVGKLCTGSSGSSLGNLIKSHRICNLDLLRMNLEDFLTSQKIRKFYRNPSVKTSRTKKGRIKRIRTVCRCKDHDTLGSVKAIHLCQKLVQCLLAFIITACKSCAVTLLTNRIDLIDKDNTRCLLIGLLKKITDLGRTHTNKHLYKFRS